MATVFQSLNVQSSDGIFQAASNFHDTILRSPEYAISSDDMPSHEHKSGSAQDKTTGTEPTDRICTWLTLIDIIGSRKVQLLEIRSIANDEKGIYFSRRSGKIGTGSSADVYVGSRGGHEEPTKVAIKRTNASRSPGVWLSAAWKEIVITTHPVLKNHQNVVNLVGYGFDPRFNDFLFTEFADLGSLNVYVSRNQGSLGWDQKMKIASDIAEGLRYLHSLDIVHNDVKPANVRMFADDKANFGLVARICDFGASVLEARDGKKKRPGHKYWAAPETYYDIREPVDVTKQRDIYSLGMLMFHLALEIQQVTCDDRALARVHACKNNGDAFLQPTLEALHAVQAPESFIRVIAGCLSRQLGSRLKHLGEVWSELRPSTMLGTLSEDIFHRADAMEMYNEHPASLAGRLSKALRYSTTRFF
jgi:Protein kinase domain